ncbi:MAG: enoyl-CoA hydratase-related protein [Caldilineaceae bacterium]
MQINRPDALNALNAQVLSEITTALRAFDNDDTTGCAILTGNDKAFAAGPISRRWRKPLLSK